MAEPQTFLILLETTILAPRLSGSKVKELTDQSQRLFSQDSKLVSSFLRLNNSLPPTSQSRISSLYVFDAIARATQKAGGVGMGMLKKLEAVVGSWVTGMVDDGKGGVWVEGKDKVRKIVEIWTKAGTFPPACLERLSANVRSPDYEPPPPIMSPALPPAEYSRTALGGYATGNGQDQTQAGPSRSPAAPPPAPGTLPPEILALLGVAVQTPSSTPQKPVDPRRPNGNVPPSINLPLAAPQPAKAGGIDIASILANVSKPAPIGVPGQSAPPPLALNPAQLAELARIATLAQPGQPQPSGSFVTAPYDSTGPNQYREPFPQRASYPGPGNHDAPPRRAEYGSRTPPRRGSRDGRDLEYDDRGPPPRGWSGDRPRRDSRGSRDFGRDFDYRDSRGRERSRSPIRDTGYPRRDENRAEAMGGGRGERGRGRGREDRGGRGWRGRGGYQARGPPSEERSYGGPPAIERHSPPLPITSGRASMPVQPGKDEFGRDRPPPQEVDVMPEEGGGEEDMALDDSDEEKPAPPQNAAPSHDQQFPSIPPPVVQTSFPPMPDSTLNPSPRPGFLAHPDPGRPTLATFDVSTFHPGDPTCWAALALAFHGSTGREPNQIELMQYLATGEVPGGGGDGLGPASGGGISDSGGFEGGGGEGRGRGGYRGRGWGRGGRGGWEERR